MLDVSQQRLAVVNGFQEESDDIVPVASARSCTTAAISFSRFHSTVSTSLCLAGGHGTQQGEPVRSVGATLSAASFALAIILYIRRWWQNNRCSLRTRRPPFDWVVPNLETQDDFIISGRWRDVVEKRGNLELDGFVLPVHGRKEMIAGHVYRWALLIEQAGREQPEIQFGVQGVGFERPWRLVTTTRCARSRDEEPFLPRPNGDRRIRERDVVHLELDLRPSIAAPGAQGSLSVAVNDEPFELFFIDMPMTTPLVPAVLLGGGSRVRVRATSRQAALLVPSRHAPGGQGGLA